MQGFFCKWQEFSVDSDELVISLMESQKDVENLEGTMRLGNYPCTIEKKSKSFEAYKTTEISERHRHRFEFNNHYKERFIKAGAIFSGSSPNGSLMEILELTDHPWFVACQFHPELRSRPMEAHPLFRDFICISDKL